MRVVFRVDASTTMGTGHVMRCLTLADALVEQGAECVFIQRQHPGNLLELIEKRGYVAYALTRPQWVAQVGARYRDWLGVPVDEDASEVEGILADEDPDWLVVDHYSLDAEWERKVKDRVGALAAVDDLGDRSHDCDVLVDQNLYADTDCPYEGLLSSRSRCFLGPRYALLGPEFSRAREVVGPRRGPVGRVLVFYGGSDPSNETERALRVLSEPEFAHLAVDVVIGCNNRKRDALIAQAESRPRTCWYEMRPHLVDLMVEADLALGAGGVTTWERCALGLPSIVTAIAANQQKFNELLGERGAVRYLGASEVVTDHALRAHLAELVERPEALHACSERAWHVTDALGAFRMAEIIKPSPSATLELRPGLVKGETVWNEWHCQDRDHEPGGERSEQGAPLDEVLSDAPEPSDGPAWTLRVLSGLAVAAVEAKLSDQQGSLRQWVDPAFEGRGWDQRLLEKLLRRMAGLQTKHSEPRRTASQMGNRASRGVSSLKEVFVKLGAEPPSAKALDITVLSDTESWLNDWIPELLVEFLRLGHRVRWVHRVEALSPGHLCFLLGCGQIVKREALAFHDHNLVVHESDLPERRGWSPLTWQILEGAQRVPVTLLEATPTPDAGDIYLQDSMAFEGHELISELREHQARLTFQLCRAFLGEYPDIVARRRPQRGQPTYYRRRTSEDSELNPFSTLSEQFDLLRVVDSNRYPAYFHLRGHCYRLTIERCTNG